MVSVFLPLIDFHLPVNLREELKPGELQGSGGWVGFCLGCEMESMQHSDCSREPSARGYQPVWRLNLEAVSWLWCRGGWCVFFWGWTGLCSHVGLAKNRQLFFAEQLELERGGESLPARSLINRAASARCKAAIMLASSAAALPARIADSDTRSYCFLPHQF